MCKKILSIIIQAFIEAKAIASILVKVAEFELIGGFSEEIVTEKSEVPMLIKVCNYQIYEA